ncbi:C6 transcription factor [Cordyceps militaris]|uniref:C6 transcription factor n=1 Tax=Cordyceps militaris TaxID=73501 RepID=A0A2H4SQE1_CORMI|nr:C6 transcription factor [Cordyceps militaris]
MERATLRKLKARRTTNACSPCRQSKIKCSGEEPCQNCQRRLVRCHFTQGNNKVVVTEKYLQDLRELAKGHRRASSAATAETSNSGDQPPTGGSQPSPQDGPPSVVSASSQAAQDSNTPPLSKSPIHHGPLLGLKRSTETAFGAHGSAYGMSGPGINGSPASQSILPGNPFERSNCQHEAGPDVSATGPSPGWMPANHLQAKQKSMEWVSAASARSETKLTPRIVWLAPWSTWSFTVRLTLMLSDKLRPEDTTLPPSLLGTETYILTYRTSSSNDLPDVSNLPSLSHALYLFSTVKFHLGQTYRLFDEDEFEQQIRDFYPNALPKAIEYPLWFSKFLLAMAFGTAFHAPPSNSQDPPGSKFFARAMALLPEPNSLWKDSFMAMEVLALGGLYLYSVDQREAANFVLGQAVRIAQLEGMHTNLPEHELGTGLTTYARDLWWTLYIMDRHFSSSVGLPMSVQDSDITTLVSPPGTGTAADSARSLQVNLSHLMSLHPHQLFHPRMSKSDGQKAVYKPSCVVFATRPLLLSVMKERLDLLGCRGDEDWTDFLAQTGSVISTGIKSAAKTLQILTSEYSVLDSFLPYDVEFTFGAALNLTMANAVFPGVVDYEICHGMSHQILDDLVARGNRVALARRSELSHLEDLCHELISRGNQQGLATLQLLGPEPQMIDIGRRSSGNNDVMDESHPLTSDMDMSQTMHLLPHTHPMRDSEFLENIGISSEDFLSIVEGMGGPDTFPDNMLTLN